MRRLIVLPTLAVAVVLLAPAAARAHKLLAEWTATATELRVEAGYEGDEPVQGGTVTVTDAAGAVVASGKTDDRGVWACPRPAAGTYTIVVEQVGHRAKMIAEIPEAAKPAAAATGGLDRKLGLLIGLGVILGASLLFRFARKKPTNGGAS